MIARKRLSATAITVILAAAAGGLSNVLASDRPASAQSSSIQPVSAVGLPFTALSKPASPFSRANPFAGTPADLGGADPADARPVGPAAANVWALANRSEVCLAATNRPADGGVGISCAPKSIVASQGLFMRTSPDPDAKTTIAAAVTVMLPDGVTSATASLPSGGQRQLPVVNNAFVADFDEVPSSIRFVTSDGAVHNNQIGR